MRIRNTMIAAVVAVGAAVGSGAPDADKNNARAAFDRLKGLAGEWEATTAGEGKVRISYQVVAGGSALVERFTDSSMPAGSEMTTVYHLDGDRLLLTHYCVAGNQPRMRATRFDAAAGVLEFDFLDATSLPNAAAGHMHSVVYRFGDADHFTSEWRFVEGGKPKFTESARYTRVR